MLFVQPAHMEVNTMDNTRNTKNYAAHGGEEWVIGGKLTFLPGASVEGAEGLFDLPTGGGAAQLPALPDSEATTVAALRESFNALLAALRAAGLMAAAAPEDPAGGDG